MAGLAAVALTPTALAAYDLIAREFMLDGNAQLNLASFVTT